MSGSTAKRIDDFLNKVFKLLLVVIAGSVVWVLYFTPSKPKCEDEFWAIINGREFVRKALVSPSTADFPAGTRTETVTYRGDCRHFIIGYVDAQNAFGATIRQWYEVEVQWIEESKGWRRNSLIFR